MVLVIMLHAVGNPRLGASRQNSGEDPLRNLKLHVQLTDHVEPNLTICASVHLLESVERLASDRVLVGQLTVLL